MATFTDIVRKQRESGQGLGSALATAFSERAKERIDPRNYLFNRKGFATALFPGLKGYKTGKMDSEKLKGSGASNISGIGAESILNKISDSLDLLKLQFRMVAKNSIVLPQIARDANITKQNIQKLVKIQGDVASNKADMFFKRAGERESQYESAIKAGKPIPQKKEKEKEKETGLLEKIFGLLLKPISFLVTSLGTVIGDLMGGLKKLASVIGTILSLGAIKSLLPNINLPGGGKPGGKAPGGKAPVGKGLASAARAALAAVGTYASSKILGSSLPSAGGVTTKAGKPLTDFGTTGQSREMVKNKSLWGRFLAFVEKKSPKLFARVVARLAGAATLAAFPIVGWVGAAVSLGFSIWTMLELYDYWKEFNGSPEEQDVLSDEQRKKLEDPFDLKDIKSNSPTQYSDTSGAMGDAALGAAITNEVGSPEPARITSPKQAGFYSPENQKANARSEVKQFLGKSSADYISSKEGFSGKAYLDPPKNTKNRYAIGYGHVIQPHEISQGYIQLADNKKVTVKGSDGKDTTMTKDEAKLLLQSDLPKYEKLAADPLGPEAWSKLNQDQKTALISYAYNTGSTQSLVDAGLKDAVLKGNSAKAAEIISTKGIKTSDGKFSAGLEKRRLSEGALFASGGDFSYQPNALSTESTSPMQSTSTSPMSNLTTGGDSGEFDPERIKRIANLRKSLPPLNMDGSKKSDVTNVNNNVVNNNNSGGGGGAPPGGAGAHNMDLIALILDRVVVGDAVAQ